MVEVEPSLPRRKFNPGPHADTYSFCFAFGREGKSVHFCHLGLDITSEHYRRHGRIDTSPYVHTTVIQSMRAATPREHGHPSSTSLLYSNSHCTVLVLRPAALCSNVRSSVIFHVPLSLASAFEGEKKTGGYGTKMGSGIASLLVDLRGRIGLWSVDLSWVCCGGCYSLLMGMTRLHFILRSVITSLFSSSEPTWCMPTSKAVLAMCAL